MLDLNYHHDAKVQVVNVGKLKHDWEIPLIAQISTNLYFWVLKRHDVRRRDGKCKKTQSLTEWTTCLDFWAFKHYPDLEQEQ